MRAHISDRDYEQLSAYLDGQLAPGKRRKLEERMQSHPELKTELEEINRTRLMVRSIPRRRAPRNFILTPAMVGKASPRQQTITSLFPALSFASALATLALVTIMLLNYAGGLASSSTARQQGPALAMESTSLEQEMQIQAAPAQDAVVEEKAAPKATVAAAAPAAAPTATPQLSEAVVAAPESPPEEATSKIVSTLPSVITWNDPSAPQNNQGIYAYGGESGYAALPGGGYGKGGGGGGDGSDLTQPPYHSVEGGLPSGGLILPLESVEGLNADSGPEEQPAPEAQAGLALEGGGPILGLPSKEKAGKIEVQSAFGQTRSSDQEYAQPAAAAEEPAMVSGKDEIDASQYSGPVPLFVIEALLALLAISTGVAAYLVRRKRA